MQKIIINAKYEKRKNQKKDNQTNYSINQMKMTVEREAIQMTIYHIMENHH